LFEELSTRDEATDKTLHPKIFIGRLAPRSYESVVASLDSLAALADGGAHSPAIVEKMRELVPELQREAAVHVDAAALEEQRPAAVIPIRRPA